MIAALKLALAGGLLAAAVPMLAVSEPQQDPQAATTQDPADSFRQESTWNFALLQYTDVNGSTVEVAARLVTKIWLLKSPEGDLRMEILYENRDYSSIAISSFSLIRSSAGLTAVDVPIQRGSIESMAFPAFR